MVVHTGTTSTHRDISSATARRSRTCPLTRLMGTGVVWSIDVPLDSLIEPEQLERMSPRLEPGDILLLETGTARWHSHYDRHASLSVETAQWLVDQQVKLLAIDMLTPELSIGRRRGLRSPCTGRSARRCPDRGIGRGRWPLAGGRAEFLFLPLNIVGGDGAPARVLGRPVQD